jgi:tetratricopeptide (TPR) repeat protein
MVNSQTMLPNDLPEETTKVFSSPYKYAMVIAALIAVGGIVAAWLGGQGILPIDPGVTLGLSILVATITLCCAAVIMQGTYASRIVNYSEMELRFEEGMGHFDNEEWENALLIFTELAGPKMDHKRATYYAARCYEQLEDWENVKRYTMAYLKMQPRDAEAWELLARAHKTLFEYEEAQYARAQADLSRNA